MMTLLGLDIDSNSFNCEYDAFFQWITSCQSFKQAPASGARHCPALMLMPLQDYKNP